MKAIPRNLKEESIMSTQVPFLHAGDESFTVINACYTLTDQYRNILIDLGREHNLSENEMLVLVHLALYPEARTQKQLQATQLHLSVSSICRMVDSLRKKGYLVTRLDENDRRSWIICMEKQGRDVADEFRRCLHQRLETIFRGIPGFDVQGFAAAMAQAAAMASEGAVSA